MHFHKLYSGGCPTQDMCFLRKAAEAAMEESFHRELPVPWDRECALTRRLLVDGSVNGKCRFHVIDPWHVMHLGIGKAWVASGVMMLQTLLPESTIGERIASLAAGYRAFCKREKLDPVIRRVDLHTFGGTAEPNGTWNKAAVTSNFMMFLEDFCMQHSSAIEKDQPLRIFVPRFNFVRWLLLFKLFVVQNFLLDPKHCFRDSSIETPCLLCIMNV